MTRKWAAPMALLVLLFLFSFDAFAAPRHGELVSSLTEMFNKQKAPALIFDAAKRTFWMLATMGLVWNLGVILLRRGDFGELFLELIRFIVFTGVFYWLLTESTSENGFVYKIINSFATMGERRDVEDVAANGDNIIQLGLNVFYKVLQESQNWSDADILVASGLSLGIIVALTFLAAQLALVIIMAWMLAYAGIFLLGLGGTRWTSPVAIGFYKNVLALGASLMLLIFLIKFGEGFLEQQADVVLAGSGDGLDYVSLADMLVVTLLLAVLGIKVPGLIYTTVTGSPLGLFGGTASVAGSAISSGGSHLYSTTYSSIANYRQGGGARSADVPLDGGGGSGGASSAIDAIRNSSTAAAMEDVIFTPMNAESGVAGNNEGSVFGQGAQPSAWSDAQRSAGALHRQSQAQSRAQDQAQTQASNATEQARSRGQAQAHATSTSTVQVGAAQSNAAQGIAAATSNTVAQQEHMQPTAQASKAPLVQAVQSSQPSAGSLAQDVSRNGQPLQQAVSATVQSSAQMAMPTQSPAQQDKAPLGLTHAKPDMLAGNVKLAATQQPAMPSSGFQPEALSRSGHASPHSVERASIQQPSMAGPNAKVMPTPTLSRDTAKGVQQSMHSAGVVTPGDGRDALPPLTPNVLGRPANANNRTNMTEQVAAITAKVNRNMGSHLPVKNASEAQLPGHSGHAPSAEDEVAAFRDRHLSDSSDN